MTTKKGRTDTIDEYIASFPPAVSATLQTIRETILDEAPDATEAMKYGMPTFVFHGNLVYFAAWKKHVGFYPITEEMETTLDELAAYNTSGKGTVQFPFNKPMPLDLIRKIVAIRVKENLRNRKE